MATKKKREAPRAVRKSAGQKANPGLHILAMSAEHFAGQSAGALIPTLQEALAGVGEYHARVEAASIRETDPDHRAALEVQLRASAPAATEAFQRSALRLVGSVSRALLTGDTADIEWLARQLDARKRRAWARVCLSRINLSRASHEIGLARDPVVNDNAGFVAQLGWVDERADALKQELVTHELRRRAGANEERVASQAAALAARLACACGAFDYAARDYEKAKRAFSAALRDA